MLIYKLSVKKGRVQEPHSPYEFDFRNNATIENCEQIVLYIYIYRERERKRERERERKR